MHALVFLAVFSIRLGVASRKTALHCVLLTHRPYRRDLPAPPERAPVQAPGAWFWDVAFLTGAVPGQFSSPANDAPRGLPSLSVVPNPPPGGFFPSSRRRCPSLYHIRAKAIYPCRSTARLRTAGGATMCHSRTPMLPGRLVPHPNPALPAAFAAKSCPRFPSSASVRVSLSSIRQLEQQCLHRLPSQIDTWQ